MALKLDYKQSELLTNILREAFSLNDFASMLYLKLDKQIDDYRAVNDFYPTVILNVIRAANQGYWADKLIAAARETNPGHPKLWAFSQQFDLASTQKPRQELEKIIRETNSFLDVNVWRQLLGQLETKVCRVEIETNRGTVFGTGFLLSPNLVLTNYHVVDSVIEGEKGNTNAQGRSADHTKLQCRFDYKRISVDEQPGTEINDGVIYNLADEWYVDGSPNAPLDQPSPDSLDYALLRLEGTPGEDFVGGHAGGVKRGWISIPTQPHDFAPESSVFILQHPQGSPLKLALDTKSVLGLFDDNSRVRYTTNTLPGSSGSPCFSEKWDLVALHHSGDPNFDPDIKPAYNEGIPISAIVGLMKHRDVYSQLGVQEL